MIQPHDSHHGHTSTSPKLKAAVGETGWNSASGLLGYALAVGGSVISFIEPWDWRLKLGAFLAWTVLTTYLLLFNGWFRNKALVWKNRQQDKTR